MVLAFVECTNYENLSLHNKTKSDVKIRPSIHTNTIFSRYIIDLSNPASMYLHKNVVIVIHYKTLSNISVTN